MRWNWDANQPPAVPVPRAANMSPSWLIVEYARTRLMSIVTAAMLAAKRAEIIPTHPTAPSQVWLNEKIGYVLATKYTPALTIVAACIKALTVVGPSIASGNQTCRGTCADLPMAPIRIRIPVIVSNEIGIAPCVARVLSFWKSIVPVVT